MSQELIDCLSTLESTDTETKIYVNPENIDEYEFSQHNAPKGWISIGTLESLSFGSQNTFEAVECFLKRQSDRSFNFNGTIVRFNLKGLLSAYSERTIRGNDELFDFLEEKAEEIEAEYAQAAASDFVECTLPSIIEQSLAEAERYPECAM